MSGNSPYSVTAASPSLLEAASSSMTCRRCFRAAVSSFASPFAGSSAVQTWDCAPGAGDQSGPHVCEGDKLDTGSHAAAKLYRNSGSNVGRKCVRQNV